MNFFKSAVVIKGDSAWLDEGSFQIKMPSRLFDLLKKWEGKTVIAGVRPEDIYDKLFYRIGPIDGNVFTATVDIIEPLGAEIYLHLNTGKNLLVAKVDPHNTASPNQLMEVVVNTEKLKIFDPESEAALN
jgi:multiple sugar transport system ATP-binding protein